MPYKPTHANGTFTKFGAPEIDKLYNDRYRIVVRCNVKGVDSKWHYSNVENFWKDFGSLYESPLQVDGADVGWEPATGETYPNMRLIEVAQNYPRTPNDGAPVLEFTYETLTGSYVQDADDKVDHELNGLRRVTRTVIATEDSSYAKVVGTDTIDHTGRGYGSETLTLASAEEVPKRQNEGGFTRIQETWVASGTLSETTDNVGSQQSKVIETIGADPATPSGYSLASKQESNFEGLQTNRFTFLKDNVILSESEDKVGSQAAIVKEVFNGTPDTPSGYSVASTQESDVDGIPTKRYTFLKDNVVLSESEDEVGSQNSIVQEVFNGTPDTPSGYSVASKQESNVDGIPTKRYTFLKDNVVLSESEDKVGSQAAIVQEVFNGTPATPGGYVVASEQESDVDGIPTRRYTFLRDNSIMSESRDRVGSQLAITQEVFGNDPETPSGYSLASSRESDVDGISTRQFTFLKDNVILSESEDKVGSQRAIVQEVFNGTPETPSGYSLAFSRESDVDGISTRRFTFLKPSVLSRNISKRSNGKLIIETVEAFNETPTATTSGAVEIGNDVSNVEGIPTRRFTFAKGEGTIRTSTRPGQIPGTIEKTVISYGTEVVPTGELIASSQTEEDGYVQYINTAIQGSNITGTKQTYKDVVQVEVPGEVECTTVSVSSGGESGTIAVPKVVPRKRKTIAATVTVEILTTPTNTASVAYDLGEISCSVTSTNVSLTEGPGSTVTIGTNAVVSDTGFVKNFGASARISTYPGCYLTSASSSGTVSYITSSQPVASGNTITREESTSNRSTECIGTGSTSLTGYLETGVVQRKSRPVLTALNGTTYYEVITWSV
jgi:hypothetical protein